MSSGDRRRALSTLQNTLAAADIKQVRNLLRFTNLTCTVLCCVMMWCVVLCCVVVCCVVVWCGVVWCDVMCCGVMWCDVLWCVVMWCVVLWCDVLWCGVVCCGVVCCGVVCCPLTCCPTQNTTLFISFIAHSFHLVAFVTHILFVLLPSHLISSHLVYSTCQSPLLSRTSAIAVPAYIALHRNDFLNSPASASHSVLSDSTVLTTV